MNVVKFEPRHIALVEAAGGRKLFGPLPFAPGAAELCAEHPAWSIFDNGQILACGGIHLDHEQCGTVWSLLLPATGKRMRYVHRIATYALNTSALRRLQAHASPTFAPALRWLEMLGFDYEGRMRKFTPNGSDMLLFARIR